MLRRAFLIAAVAAAFLAIPMFGESTEDLPKTNKLLFMYRMFYLPFQLDFQVGRSIDTILPYVLDAHGESSRLVEAHELVTLDAEWMKIRKDWRAKSLLEFNTVGLNQSLRITQRLASHRISVKRRTSDVIPVGDRPGLNQALKGKSPNVIASYYQLRFLKSLMDPTDENKFNFFVLSASWCDSSREYRTLLEAYFKKFANPNLTLHSIIVDDPKREIFDSPLMKELFPHPKQYTHETVPRFLALQVVNGEATVWEEGDALRELYDRFYAPHRGFLSSEVKGLDPALAKQKPGLQPVLSSVSK